MKNFDMHLLVRLSATLTLNRERLCYLVPPVFFGFYLSNSLSDDHPTGAPSPGDGAQAFPESRLQF